MRDEEPRAEAAAGPPTKRERKAVLYTRKQLEILERQCVEQQLTIERLASENHHFVAVIKQHDVDNGKRAKYQREKEQQHARDVDKLHRQGRLELSAAAQSRRLREASIAMMEKEISRLSKLLAKKHPGKGLDGPAHMPLISEIRAEYEMANEALRLRVIELEHMLADRTHESAARAGPTAVAPEEPESNAEETTAVDADAAREASDAADAAARDLKKRLAAEKDGARRLQRQLTAITAERDTARAAASEKESGLRREASRAAHFEAEAKKAQADARSARKNLKTATAQLDVLRASASATAASNHSAEAATAELASERQKRASVSKKLESKAHRLANELAAMTADAGRTAKEHTAMATQLDRLKAVHAERESALKSQHTRVRQLEAALAKAKAATIAVETALTQATADRKAESSKQHAAEKSAQSRVKIDADALRARVGELEGDATKLKATAVTEAKEKATLANDLKAATVLATELEDEATALRATVAALEEEQAGMVQAHAEEAAAIRAELELTEAELADKSSQVAEDGTATAELGTLRQGLAESSDKVSALEKEAEALRSDLAELKVKSSEAEARLADEHSKRSAAEANLLSAEGKLSESNAKLSDGESSLAQLNAKLAEAEASLSESETNWSAAEVKASMAEAKVAEIGADSVVRVRDASTKAEELAAESTKEAARLAASEARIASLLSDLTSTRASETGAQTARQTAEDATRVSASRCAELERDIETARTQRAEAQAQQDSATNTIRERDDQVQTLSTEATAHGSEISRLKALVSHLENTGSATAGNHDDSAAQQQLAAARAETTAIQAQLDSTRAAHATEATGSRAAAAARETELEAVRALLATEENAHSTERERCAALVAEKNSLEETLASERAQYSLAEAQRVESAAATDVVSLPAGAQAVSPESPTTPAIPTPSPKSSPKGTVSPRTSGSGATSGAHLPSVDDLIRTFLENPKNGFCVALFDSPVNQPDAEEGVLPFAKDDILALGGGDPTEYFVGSSVLELGDGLVPSNYVNVLDKGTATGQLKDLVRSGKVTIDQFAKALELAEAAVVSDDEYYSEDGESEEGEDDGEVVATLAVALFDYTPEAGSGHLAFRTGQVLLLNSKLHADGFFDGERDGEVGAVPSNFVALLLADDLDSHADPIRCTVIETDETLYIPRDKLDFGSSDEVLVNFAQR
eukprot:m.279418 g.279418  ORF g.279418 m.279418 type:complete len:1183 (+) comp26964_c0_seq1:39-3587(+)